MCDIQKPMPCCTRPCLVQGGREIFYPFKIHILLWKWLHGHTEVGLYNKGILNNSWRQNKEIRIKRSMVTTFCLCIYLGPSVDLNSNIWGSEYCSIWHQWLQWILIHQLSWREYKKLHSSLGMSLWTRRR